ncbi:MAG: hypothetical protein MJA29_00100 [Candidatus Omnitrophica bacterium]|nr:hypothetical protein [Candidatus Omnitrophota bacterium]
MRLTETERVMMVLPSDRFIDPERVAALTQKTLRAAKCNLTRLVNLGLAEAIYGDTKKKQWYRSKQLSLFSDAQEMG